ELLGGSADIERVQILIKLAVELGLGQYIDSVGAQFNHRRAGNADLGHQVLTSDVIGAADRTATGRNEARLPVDRSVVSIDGIHAIVLGDYVENVVRPTVDVCIRNIQR